MSYTPKELGDKNIWANVTREIEQYLVCTCAWLLCEAFLYTSPVSNIPLFKTNNNLLIKISQFFFVESEWGCAAGDPWCKIRVFVVQLIQILYQGYSSTKDTEWVPPPATDL